MVELCIAMLRGTDVGVAVAAGAFCYCPHIRAAAGGRRELRKLVLMPFVVVSAAKGVTLGKPQRCNVAYFFLTLK